MAAATIEEPADDNRRDATTEPAVREHSRDGNTRKIHIPRLRTINMNMRCLFAVTYFITAAAFLFGVNTRSIAKLRYKFVGNLLPESVRCTRESTVVVLIVMWGLHFVRLFSESLFLYPHDKRVSTFTGLMATLFYVLFGMWVGWSINFHLRYHTPMFWILMVGVGFYLTGEVGCSVANVLAMWHRQERATADDIYPTGRLFRYISSPQNAFEIIAYTGLLISTFTLASIVFVCINIIILVRSAHKTHAKCAKQMEEAVLATNYSSNRPKRKALIPFIF